MKHMVHAHCHQSTANSVVLGQIGQKEKRELAYKERENGAMVACYSMIQCRAGQHVFIG